MRFHRQLVGLFATTLLFIHGCSEHPPAGGPRNQSSDGPLRSKPVAPIPANADSVAAESEAGSSKTSQLHDGIPLFEVKNSSGITFVHDDGSFGKFCLPETMGGGLALFDFDADGLIDLYLCNGKPLDPDSKASGSGNALYRNLGEFQFSAVASQAGVASYAYSLGATVGDYDNDGFPDLFLSNFGRNTLFHNNGDGTFESSELPGDEAENERFSAGACFADLDSDGGLDLFVGNYVCLTPQDIVDQSRIQRTTYPGPQDFRPELNSLFRNSNDGSWINISRESKIDAVRGTAMGCISGDFDRDGDVDVYVVNDEMPNFLFRNQGDAVFSEGAFSLGLAVNEVGNASGSMGVDAGDLNNDGRDDLFVTTFENESVNLFQMIDQGLFQEVSRQTHAGNGTAPLVTWGCCVGDLDHDGDRDIYVASGHLDLRSGERLYRSPNLVLKNLLQERQQFRFANVTERSGDMGGIRRCSRGAGLADLDNDGDLDIVVMNLRDQPTLIENRSSRPQSHWLQLKLVGTTTNRDANGSRIRVVADSLEWVDEVRNGRGYQSYWGSRLHFGLGARSAIQRIEINWLSGHQQVIENVPPNGIRTIVEAAQ